MSRSPVSRPPSPPLVALASPAAAQTQNLHFATLAPDTFPYVDGMKKFKEAVEARSNGRDPRIAEERSCSSLFHRTATRSAPRSAERIAARITSMP